MYYVMGEFFIGRGPIYIYIYVLFSSTVMVVVGIFTLGG